MRIVRTAVWLQNSIDVVCIRRVYVATDRWQDNDYRPMYSTASANTTQSRYNRKRTNDPIGRLILRIRLAGGVSWRH